MKFHIAVGFDFSPCGKRALADALRIAYLTSQAPGDDTDVELHVVHALTRQDVKDAGSDARGGIAKQDAALADVPHGLMLAVLEVMFDTEISLDAFPIMQHVRIGKPVEVIRQCAVDCEADLVVVGTHNRSALGRMVLGSVAETLVRDGRFPVLVAHRNTLAELPKTERPDAPLTNAQLAARSPGGDRPHTYRFSLVDAWSAFGHPTSTSSGS